MGQGEGEGEGWEERGAVKGEEEKQPPPRRLGQPRSSRGGEGEEFAEADPRTLLASRMHRAVHDMGGVAGAGGLHAREVERIREAPLAEEGAVVDAKPHRPAVQGKEASGAQQTRGGGGGRTGGTGPDVLLVEDVRVSQKIAQAALSRAHYKVDVASDGESAVEKYRQHAGSLRVILMDVGLPGISGIEASEKIRKIERETGAESVLIYGLTGNVAEANLRQYEQAGMNGCIVKGKLLVDAVKQAMIMTEKNPAEFVNLSETAMQKSIPAPRILPSLLHLRPALLPLDLC